MQIYMPFLIKLRNFDTVSKFDLDARDKEKARIQLRAEGTKNR